ncbi:MAG: ribosome recycling factor [Negativicutes bacterium]|nr:ribosome recycling factor [Negativicutes bacterium]
MKDYLKRIDERMEKTIAALKKDLISVRAGRANPGILEKVTVDYYGAATPLAQVGNISCPDARTIVIQPWDKNLIKAIEKAILTADLGLNPSNDGIVIRLVVPALTEQRRKELCKTVEKKAEEAKVALRNIRREANEEAKKLEKSKEFTEDDVKQAQEECQKKTDKYIREVDTIVSNKEKDIMAV